MTIEDNINFISTLEEKFDVDNWSINDLKIWPLVRIKLGYYLAYIHQADIPLKKESTFSKFQSLAKSAWAALLNYLCAVFFSFRQNYGIREKNINYFFLTLSYDRVLINNKYYNKLIDPIIDQIEPDNIGIKVFEYRTGGFFKYPKYRAGNYFFFLPLLFKFRSLFFKRRIIGTQLQDYDKFLQLLQSRDIPIENFTFDKMAGDTSFIELNAEYFDKVFKRYNVQMAFTTEYYSFLSFAMVLAANRLGIPTVDIQHGLQNEYHYAYAKWVKIPQDSFKLLPKFFFVWSENENDLIKSWMRKNPDQHKPIIVGNLFLDKFKANKESFVEIYNNKALALRNPNKKNVLLTLQNTLPPAWLINYINNSHHKIEWWVRSHPVWQDVLIEFMKSLDEKVTQSLIDPNLISSLPLYSVIKSVDINVIQTSTTVIEAALFDKPTLIVENEGLLHYKMYLSKKLAFPALNKDEFEAVINRIVLSDEIAGQSVKSPDINRILRTLHQSNKLP